MFIARFDGPESISVENPTHSDLRGLVARLDADNPFLILDQTDTKGIIQVLQDGDGWIVERHDPESAEHYRADTSSSDRVVAALTGWMDGKPDDRSGLDWFDISADFRKPWWRRLFGGRG